MAIFREALTESLDVTGAVSIALLAHRPRATSSRRGRAPGLDSSMCGWARDLPVLPARVDRCVPGSGSEDRELLACRGFGRAIRDTLHVGDNR